MRNVQLVGGPLDGTLLDESCGAAESLRFPDLHLKRLVVLPPLAPGERETRYNTIGYHEYRRSGSGTYRYSHTAGEPVAVLCRAGSVP